MSIRNDITVNIVDLLGDSNDPKPIYVTRDSIDLENLSRQQFPAVVVRSGDETRTEFTMATSNQRNSIFNVQCLCYVTGNNIDLQRNDIAERVEEVLAVDEEIDQRFGLITLNFEVEYQYTRGEA